MGFGKFPFGKEDFPESLTALLKNDFPREKHAL